MASVADPHHFDPDPDRALLFDADPDPSTQFFPDLDPPMLQNDPVRLPPFHFDADPDPDPAFKFDADLDPQNCLELGVFFVLFYEEKPVFIYSFWFKSLNLRLGLDLLLNFAKARNLIQFPTMVFL